MKSPAAEKSHNADEGKWGYAIAGACALGFAAIIQLAFGGLDEEALAKLPAVVTVPYGLAGKLGITAPLALLGVALILRDVLVNRGVTGTGSAAPRSAGRGRAADEEDLELGEPIPDEASAAAKQPAPKIAARAGGFGGRVSGAAGAAVPTGGPVGDSSPVTQRADSGQVVLSSAKYLNPNPVVTFRKGSTHNTTDE
jgi:hypothetical protein